MTIPASGLVLFSRYLFFFTFVSTNIKNWAYGNILHWSRCPWEDADMLRESVHTCDRLYERKRCKELGEW